MARYQAITTNGIVTNVIVADAWPDAVDVTDLTPRPGPGWLYNGVTFTAPLPPPPVAVTEIERANLLARLTPVELHAWIRAANRAGATNSPVVADRNALYAWTRWQAMNGNVDMASADIKGLANVWIALGMTPARAAELLVPLAL